MWQLQMTGVGYPNPKCKLFFGIPSTNDIAAYQIALPQTNVTP